MKHDPLTQYISLRDALVREKAELEQRLREISQALGSDQGPGNTAAATSTPSTPPAATPAFSGRRGGRGNNSLSLREAVIEALSEQSLSRREIIVAVQRLGYRFASKDPLNSLGMVLYGKNPRFRNIDGRYVIEGRAPAKAAAFPAPQQAVNPYQEAASPYRSRKMSNSAREKLRAIARARWARAKAQGRSAL